MEETSLLLLGSALSPWLGAEPRANSSSLGRCLASFFNTRNIIRGNPAKSPRGKALLCRFNGPLFIAAYRGHAAVTKQLIEARRNVNLQKKNGSSSLNYTARADSPPPREP